MEVFRNVEIDVRVEEGFACLAALTVAPVSVLPPEWRATVGIRTDVVGDVGNYQLSLLNGILFPVLEIVVVKLALDLFSVHLRLLFSFHRLHLIRRNPDGTLPVRIQQHSG